MNPHEIRRIVVCVGRGRRASFWVAMKAGFVGWLFQNAKSVKIAHKNMGEQAEVMFVYSAEELAIFEGRRPARKEMKASWSHAMLLEEVMVEIKTASTAERAAILVVLKMLDEVRGLHVQPEWTEWTEGHECGCKEYVVKMIDALSADGRVVAEFAAQREQSRVWREMQARREEQPEQPKAPMPKSRLRRGRPAAAQPEPMPKRAKSAPKNKNLYTKHLTGLVVTGVLQGGSDSQIALGVEIEDSGKTKMMAHYLKGRPQADLDQMIGAVRQFMQSMQSMQSGALSKYDRVACERFIFLIELLGAP